MGFHHAETILDGARRTAARGPDVADAARDLATLLVNLVTLGEPWRQRAFAMIDAVADAHMRKAARYMAALRFDSLPANLPAGFDSETLEASRYVKVPFLGTPPEMGQEFQRIFNEVLPELGFSIQPGFCCLEEYPEEGAWDEATGRLKADLYVELL